jgi:uncharacterized protein YjbI with pentapeptide repeats
LIISIVHTFTCTADKKRDILEFFEQMNFEQMNFEQMNFEQMNFEQMNFEQIIPTRLNLGLPASLLIVVD